MYLAKHTQSYTRNVSARWVHIQLTDVREANYLFFSVSGVRRVKNVLNFANRINTGDDI